MRNDRLKFRAWNPKTKTMMRVGEFPIYHEEDNGFHSGEPCEETGWTEFDIMQWTGLYDCEGVEVYSCDILGGGQFVPGKVVFHDGSFRVDQAGDNQSSSVLNQWRVSRLKVIGNVYETPELIENG